MSNEYKDWERDKIEEEKQIVSIYPFLRLRDIDGTICEDDKFPMIGLEIPNGWYKVFFQMCNDIKPILERERMLDTFYFIQVKEKYNSLRCYHNGAPKEVEDIIAKYEIMSYYICTVCGKPATYETQGYIASLCNNCYENNFKHISIKRITFEPYYRISGYGKNNYYTCEKCSYSN